MKTKKSFFILPRLLLVLFYFLIAGCSTMKNDSQRKAALYFDIGASHLQNQNYPLALQNFLEAEKLDSSDFRVQNALGLVYLYREKPALSEKHFRNALSLKPDDTETRNNLAQLLIDQKRYTDAENELKKSLSDLTFPQPDKSYFLMGYLKFSQSSFSAAAENFERSLRFKKDDCQAQAYYGRTLFELSRYPEASVALDRAVGFCQNLLYDEPHYYSALAYYRLGEIEKSKARFKEVFEVYPQGQYRTKAKAMFDMMKRVQN